MKKVKYSYYKLSKTKYEDYLKKLLAYCDLVGVEVKITPKKSGMFDFTNKVLYYGKENSRADTISIILHELGHFRDDIKLLNKNPEMYEALDKLYNKKNYSIDDVKIVIDCETRAWAEAEYLAKELNIKLGSWFDTFRKKCLKTYFDISV